LVYSNVALIDRIDVQLYFDILNRQNGDKVWLSLMVFNATFNNLSVIS
jgi:hypothetical protein